MPLKSHPSVLYYAAHSLRSNPSNETTAFHTSSKVSPLRGEPPCQVLGLATDGLERVEQSGNQQQKLLLQPLSSLHKSLQLQFEAWLAAGNKGNLLSVQHCCS